MTQIGDSADELTSDLIDVSDMDLEELAALPPSALGESLRRIRRDGAEEPFQYAGFQNVVTTDRSGESG